MRRVLEEPLGEVEPLPGALERLDGVGERRRPRPGGDRLDLGTVLGHPRLELWPEVDTEVGQAHPRECGRDLGGGRQAPGVGTGVLFVYPPGSERSSAILLRASVCAGWAAL